MPKNDEVDLLPNWPFRASLTNRILALNILALAMLAGGFFYLDSYRTRLVDQRVDRAAVEATIMAEALQAAAPDRYNRLLVKMAQTTGQRVRIYAPDGHKIADSWNLAPPNYRLVDPHAEHWRRHVARLMDRIIDKVVSAAHPPLFEEPAVDQIQAWTEAKRAWSTGRATIMVRNAADRTPMVSAAATFAGPHSNVLLTTTNAREITKIVRAERFRLGVVLALVIAVSVLLSLFLGRTIVQPLRRLARAAILVRQGRAREVEVPRLPRRSDEIGLLARALSDMSQALRQRIDATEAFAADVAHELKNPLASVSSAVDSLALVKSTEQRDQLIGVIREDVVRLDRLISDMAEVSRLDAELSRTRFETVDLGALVGDITAAYTLRENQSGKTGPRIAFARPRAGTAIINGDEFRLARAISNLLDNAISFSPTNGLIEVTVARVDDEVRVQIQDEGPGVPFEVRHDIFDRFYTQRPPGEAFGKHSGLGLAIVRSIVEAHDGSAAALDRADGQRGARFLLRLPAIERSA